MSNGSGIVTATTFGPRIARVRPFVRAGAGFLQVADAPEPIACIAIFPPPLSCLIGGDTLPAFDLGDGVEVFTTTPRLCGWTPTIAF